MTQIKEIVMAIVIVDSKVLVSRRLQSAHLGGFWEFPGGKCEQGESARQALTREALEELGIVVCVGKEFDRYTWDYTTGTLDLRFFHSSILKGDPRSLASQEIRWVTKKELTDLEFPPANDRIVEGLLSLKWD